MESPVRSVETGENGSGAGGGGANQQQQQDKATAAGQAGAGGAAAAETSPSQRFEAKSYLERQVEELSCADEDEAQEKVSQRLQLKQDQAQKKRYGTFLPSFFNENIREMKRKISYQKKWGERALMWHLVAVRWQSIYDAM
ncbi:hypothetical protein Esi_0197_0037 [Ectocarpus siliculosus]|uniref:Uncharacterized protein n=1 Tax=Ectocarpus siliculosus TaxID=2880 RepID=D8LHM8_ECTSI|nr:hypothetical protein Esi_0197_0037 [Ectocarpus siliculosus]|eukprot:CBN79310.1 hypothetical protein Esi_0197_0037 [Ectocarpus siliculosus]